MKKQDSRPKNFVSPYSDNELSEIQKVIDSKPQKTESAAPSLPWWRRLLGLKPIESTQPFSEPEETVPTPKEWNTQEYQYLEVSKVSDKSFFDIQGIGISEWRITRYAPASQKDRVDANITVHGRLLKIERNLSERSSRNPEHRIDIRTVNHHPAALPSAQVFHFGDIQMMIREKEVIFSGEGITTQYL